MASIGMVNISRRGFLTGLAATVAAPAVITRPGILMPLRGLVMPTEVLGYTLTGGLIRWFPATGEWEWGVPKKKAPGAAQWFLLLGPPS